MTVFPSTPPTALEAVKARVRDLERARVVPPTEFEFEVSASASGMPTAGAITNPWSTRSIANMTAVFVELNTAATSDSTWQVRQNGTVVATVTVATGNDYAIVTAAVTFLNGDLLDIVATTPGTGWSRATVRAIFRTTRTRIESVTLLFPTASSVTAVDDVYYFTDLTLTDHPSSDADIPPPSSSAASVLANDIGTGLTVSSTGVITADTGVSTITMASDGTFTFHMPGPGEGVSTFTYTATDGSSSSSATITIHWFSIG